jgi:hypothetical protein
LMNTPTAQRNASIRPSAEAKCKAIKQLSIIRRLSEASIWTW